MKKIIGNIVKNVQQTLDMPVGQVDGSNTAGKSIQSPAKMDTPENRFKKPTSPKPNSQKPAPEKKESERMVIPAGSVADLLKLDHVVQWEKLLGTEISVDGPRGSPMITELRKPPVQRTETYKESKNRVHADAVRATAQLYKRIADGRPVRHDEITGLVQSFYQTLIADKNILLLLASIREQARQEDYLYSHAVSVSLLSMVLPVEMGYSREQILELGEAALLADVGMEFVPRHLLQKEGRLTRDDYYEIHKHPILGCHLLERIKGLSERVYLAAYQHHERGEGTGYPKRRRSNLIHSYAQIIGVADVYSALSTKRTYRDARIPYEAMTELLKLGKVGLLEKEKVKHFIKQLSLFPVGSLVLLRSGRIGRVIAPGLKDYTRPVIAVLAKSKDQLLDKDEIKIMDLGENTGEAVAAALPDNFIEISPMLGF